MAYIDIHTHNLSHAVDVFAIYNPQNLQYADNEILEKQVFSIGVHPWNINPITYLAQLEEIYTNASQTNLVAIGECGLDKNIATEIELQKEIFISHVKLAEKLQKPLIIHNVRATQELIAIKKNNNANVPWIIHGFRGKPETASQLIKQGFLLSFGHHICNSQNLSQTLKSIPDECFFLETDDCEIDIKEIYLCAAKIRQVSVEQIIKIQQTNFYNIFKKIIT